MVWPAVFLGLGIIIWWQHPLLIRLWGGKWLRQYPLAGLLLAWACVTGFASSFSIFLNSLGLVKMQAAVSFAMILPNLLLPVILSRWFGLPGIALSMVVCLLPTTIIWPLYTRRALRLHLQRV
jgi:O-antigen/teichoic acid export membrane protein